ncbi:MAG: hypothetical protein P4L57_07735 [Rhizomicrobium sp.]|nr:hypothetical protein [Rhizomicrobium sp.]
MNHFRGFLLAIGRVATKATADALSRYASADFIRWNDSAKIMASPLYFFHTARRPFILTQHEQNLEAMSAILAELPASPIVYTVREPIAHLHSMAKTLLTMHVCHNFEATSLRIARGQSVVELLLPHIEQWTSFIDYMRRFRAIERYQKLVLDISDFSQSRFAGTIEDICDMFGAPCKAPVSWDGLANSAADTFFNHYRMPLSLLDREMILAFTAQPVEASYNALPGNLLPLGQVVLEGLEGLLGPSAPIHVHAAAPTMLSYSELHREQDSFAALVSHPGIRQSLASKILGDYQTVETIVAAEQDALAALMIDCYHQRYEPDMQLFVDANPAIADKWQTARAA